MQRQVSLRLPDNDDNDAARASLKRPAKAFNPFASATRDLSALGWLRLVVLLPTLGLVRIVLVLALITLAGLYTWLALLGHSVKTPLPAWRHMLLLPTRLSVRALLFVLGLYRIRVKGSLAPNVPFLVPNHISALEPLFFTSLGLSHVSTAGVKSIWPLRPFFAAFATVFVDRTDKGSCDNVKHALAARAAAPLGQFPPLCLYPEGATTNGRSLLQFKLGAFLPGSPVQPAVVRFRFAHFDPSWTDAALYWPRLLSEPCISLDVEFLPVVTPSAAEKHDAALFASRVRSVMAQALGVSGAHEFSLNDVMLQREARTKHHLPSSVGIIEAGKLQRMLSLTAAELSQYLGKFAAVNTAKNGLVSFPEFQAAMGLDASPALATKLFLLFDKNESGTIDFQEFVAGLVYVNGLVGEADVVDMACSLLDAKGTGMIPRDQFLAVIAQMASEKLDDARLLELFAAIDTAHTGVVTRDQVAEYLTNHMDLFTAPRKTQLLERFKQRLAAQLTDIGKEKSE